MGSTLGLTSVLHVGKTAVDPHEKVALFVSGRLESRLQLGASDTSNGSVFYFSHAKGLWMVFVYARAFPRRLPWRWVSRRSSMKLGG